VASAKRPVPAATDTTTSDTQGSPGDVAFCDTVVDLPFPFGEWRSHTRVLERTRPDGGFERHWARLRGTYRRNDGSWTLRPWQGDASRTLVVYRVDMEPDSIIPEFLLRRLQAETVRRVFAAVRERVRALRRQRAAGGMRRRSVTEAGPGARGRGGGDTTASGAGEGPP
jgi:hypothetical protein